MPCCPEHCCDVSFSFLSHIFRTLSEKIPEILIVVCSQWDIGTCKGDVEKQKAFRKIFDPVTWSNKLEETEDAEIKIEATGDEQVEKIR